MFFLPAYQCRANHILGGSVLRSSYGLYNKQGIAQTKSKNGSPGFIYGRYSDREWKFYLLFIRI